MKKFLIVFLSIICLSGCSTSKAEDLKEEHKLVSKSQVIQLVSDGAVIIDVRTDSEYTENHIDGAINIPYDEIESKINYSKDTKIIVYCRSGARSKMAFDTLISLGYTNVYDLGSIDNYR